MLRLKELLDVPVRQLSLGQRMRSDLAAALLHHPSILFLDEPTIGLDAVSKLAVRDFVKVLNREHGVTVLLTTHDMDDIEALCDRIIVIGKGHILHDGALSTLRAKVNNERYLMVDLDDRVDTFDEPGVRTVSREGHRLTLAFDPDVVLPTAQLITRLASRYTVKDLVVNCTFAIADALSSGFDQFDKFYVKTGEFDRLLLRPRSPVLQLAGHELALRRVGRLAQGLIVLIWASVTLELDWTYTRVALLLWTGIGGVCFFAALFMLRATFAFWSTETLELMHILSYGGLEAAQYPISIYSAAFRKFFTSVVPLACVSYFPLLSVLGVPDPLESSQGFQVFAPALGVLFLLVTVQFWRFGVRYYTSTGS